MLFHKTFFYKEISYKISTKQKNITEIFLKIPLKKINEKKFPKKYSLKQKNS